MLRHKRLPDHPRTEANDDVVEREINRLLIDNESAFARELSKLITNVPIASVSLSDLRMVSAFFRSAQLRSVYHLR